jgi:hypothetical protein
MMADIFNQESRPFYHFGDIIMLGKIPEEKWTGFIMKGFTDTGKSISEDLVRKLVATAGNHPEYVQQLAHHCWSLTTDRADDTILKNAMDLVLDTNGMFYQEMCDNLSNTQINLIKAVLGGEWQFTSAEVMRKYRLGTPRNVVKNKESLDEKDILDFSVDPPSFNDPFFKFWFGMTFL